MRTITTILLLSLTTAGCGGDSGSTPDAGPGDATPPDASSDGARPDGAPPDPADREDVTDRDGDRVPDGLDAFPDDPREAYDSDGDGVGNVAQVDEDGDGVPDVDDERPFDAASSTQPRTAAGPEGDDDAVTATGATVPFRVSGTLDSAGDLDRFGFEAPAGRRVTARIDLPSGGEQVLHFGEASGPFWLSSDLSERVSGSPTAISFSFPTDGPAQLVVAAAGETPVDYEVRVFFDADLDGLDDERELALGAHPTRLDSDGDGVDDNSELVLPLDPDGDGVPNFQDDDSDGDGLSDWHEQGGDLDGDGTPNALDTDADGDGVDDATELGDMPVFPANLDGDGQPDALDLDQDGDGWLDIHDTDPRSAAGTLAGLRLDAVSSMLSTGEEVPGVVREGATVVLTGGGFAPMASDNWLLLDGDRLVNVQPESASAGELRVTFGRDRPTRVAVVSGGRRTGWVPVRASGAGEPIVTEVESDVVTRGADVILNGYGLSAVQTAFIDGERLELSEQTDTSVTLRPAEGGSVELSYVGPDSIDMRTRSISVVVTGEWFARAVLPAGSAVDPLDLEVSGLSQEGTMLNDRGIGLVRGQADKAFLVSASIVGAAGERDTQFLSALWPGTGVRVELSSMSTAVSLVAVATGAPEIEPVPNRLATLLANAETLPDVMALAAHLEVELAADPGYLDTATPALTALVSDATLAFADTLPRSTTAPVVDMANIMPEEQWDVTLREAVGGGVSIDNATMLYLSVRILDQDTGAVLVPHVTGLLDQAMIGTQDGLFMLFRGGTASFAEPRFRNATVEIISAGGGLGLPDFLDAESSDAYFYVTLRSLIHKLVLPLIEYAVGRAVNGDSLLALIPTFLPDLVLNLRTLFRTGNPADAVNLLLSTLLTDFTNIGPFTVGLVEMLHDGVAALVARIAGRVAAKAVPGIGQVMAVLEALAASSTAASVGLYINDLFTVPPNFDFDISWQLGIEQVFPSYLARLPEDRQIIIDGSHLQPQRDPTSLPEVIFSNPSFGEITARPYDIRPDGTTMRVDLSGEAIVAADGPIDVTVRHRGQEATEAGAIAVENRFSVTEIFPTAGYPGDLVSLRGGVFSESPDQVFVNFVDDLDPLNFDRRQYRAALVETSNTEITVVVPREIAEPAAGEENVLREWFVEVFVTRRSAGSRPYRLVRTGDWVTTLTFETAPGSLEGMRSSRLFRWELNERLGGVEMRMYDVPPGRAVDLGCTWVPGRTGNAERGQFWVRTELGVSPCTLVGERDYFLEVDFTTGRIEGSFDWSGGTSGSIEGFVAGGARL